MAKLLKISTPLLCPTTTRSIGVCLLSQKVNFSHQIYGDNFFLRAYSSSRSSSSDDGRDRTLWRRFVNTAKLMAIGSKLVLSDFRKALEIRKTAAKTGFNLLSGKAPKRKDLSIPRADLSFLIQVFDCAVF